MSISCNKHRYLPWQPFRRGFGRGGWPPRVVRQRADAKQIYARFRDQMSTNAVYRRFFCLDHPLVCLVCLFPSFPVFWLCWSCHSAES